MFSVRKFIGKDIGQALEIADECGLSYWSENDYRDELLRDGAVILSLIDGEGKLSGFINGRLIGTPSGNAVSVAPLEAEIYNIGVRQKVRRSGGGTALLSGFLDFCCKNGVDMVWLEVRESNQNAIDFYQKNSFSVTGLRKNFYSHPVENAVLMTLILARTAVTGRCEFPFLG